VSQASGIAIGHETISDSYRDYARQVAYEKNPPNHVGLAAKAGASPHGWGLAIDARGLLLLWLAQHGSEYGWVRTIKAESWHFEYVSALDRHAGAEPTALPDQLTTVAPEEDAMLLIHHTNGADQAYYVTDGARLALVPPSPENADLELFKSVMRTVEVSGPIGMHPWIRLTQQLGATPDVDEGAVAAALVPLITGRLGALSTSDAQTLAKAVADELSRRMVA